MTKDKAASVAPGLASKRRTSTLPASRKKGIREALTACLKKAPATRAQLLERIGCSVAALDNHLKQMQAEGAAVATGKHPKVFSLRSSSPVAAPSSRAAALADPGIDPALLQALRYVQDRMRPPTRTERKISTLNRLADVMPDPVASVLRAISLDYQTGFLPE